MSRAPSLVLLPNLRATREADGRVGLTRKFIEGMEAFTRGWEGPVAAILEPRAGAGDNLDNEVVAPRDLAFGVEVLGYDDPLLEERLRSAGIVLGGLGYRQNHLAARARALGVPLVYGAEYTLRTRIQIARASERGVVSAARRIAWEWRQERAQRAALRAAAGLQCNGTPTYDAYASFAPRPHLFFDSRTTRALLATADEQQARAQRLRSGAPLRLLFSGRLNRMKGADHLAPLAAELQRRGTAFRLSIFGAGECAQEIRARASAENLPLELPGVLDFERELVPLVRREIDLFVCPHRQGDPSCTYLETLACGVPIVGYANEAFRGILRRAPVGEAVPIDDVRALADLVAALAGARREQLAEWSRAALSFAAQHTFEETFDRRLDHLRRVRAEHVGERTVATAGA